MTNKPNVRLEQQVKELEGKSPQPKLSVKITNKANMVWSEILDAIPDFVSLHDLDYRIVKVNKALADFLGKKPEELIGKYCYKLFHNADKPLASCPHAKAMETKEIAAKQVDDTDLGCPLLVSAAPIFADDGELIGSIHIAKDITEHKRADEALQRQHQIQSVLNKMLSISMKPYSLEEMLSNILDYIVSVPWLTLESKAAIFLVKDQSEMLEMKSFRRLPPELQVLCARVPCGQCLCGKAAQTKKIEYSDHVDERHERKYKDISPHGHYCVPILSSGNLLGVLNLYVKEGHRRNKEEEDFLLAMSHVLAGIIDKKQAEVDLQLFRNLVNQSNDAVFVIDPKTSHFMDFNDKACASLGYAREELLARGVKDIETLLPDNFSWRKHVREVRKKGNLVLEGVHKRKDGSTFPVEISVKWITQESKNYLVAVARDITERKQIEKELANYQQYLEELVEKRTTKLTKTNKQLKQEISERNRAEVILKEQAQIISQIHDAVVMTDMKGYVTFWNKGAENLFGYKAKEVYNRHISFLYRKEDKAILYNDVLVPLKEKGNHELELKQIKKSGEKIIVHLSLSLIRDSAGNIKGMASSSTDVTERRRAEEALRNALNEVEQLKNRLQAENIYLQDEIKTEHNFEEIISQGKECKKVLRKVEQVATTDATVLLQGETGTGKELLARAIHNTSKRHNRPLVKINCASIPVNLIESELFGHEKGAFTGALEKKIGRFELADKGTIFLDEIGELPLELQSKLLRVLQEGEFERLGNPRTIKVDVRVIAATNRDLEKALKMGNFRQDLYYRLNVFPIKCPPLRERKEDIPLLVNHFIKRFCAKLGKKIETVPLDVMTSLQDYHWPGNVRELENVIERAVILSEGSILRVDELFDRFSTPLDQVEDLVTVKEAEKSLILKILEETNWMVGGKRGAAARLGIAPSTLRDRIKKFGLKRPL